LYSNFEEILPIIAKALHESTVPIMNDTDTAVTIINYKRRKYISYYHDHEVTKCRKDIPDLM
jgi:hypothetical protein